MPMIASNDQAETIQFLANPATHDGRPVERMSTHGAHIFLTGTTAIKLKRAVKLPFMDFSTLERRHRALIAELNRNRATAPSIYREVRAIRIGRDGKPTFDGNGPVIDWVLVMNRFDQDALLDNMATSGTIEPSMMDRLADQIVAMHAGAPIIDRDESTYFTESVKDDIAVIRRSQADLANVERLAEGLTAGCNALADHLRRRARDGFVRLCHGDLHLRNIVVIDGVPTPFDALEFDPALASGDVYFDLAFLLMDLEHRDLRALAHRLFNRYVMATGDDDGLTGLQVFLAVRATVRAKVAVIEAATIDDQPARTAKTADANRYITLANRYLQSTPLRLTAVGGLSGSGKSTLAMALAPVLTPAPGPVVVRSDVIRKRLMNAAETERLGPDGYTDEMNLRVYDVMTETARKILTSGHSVIVDAVFARPTDRQRFETIARSAAAQFTGLWLDAPTDVRKQRVASRPPDASDATPALAERQTDYDIGDLSWHRLNAGGDLTRTVELARTRIATALSSRA